MHRNNSPGRDGGLLVATSSETSYAHSISQSGNAGASGTTASGFASVVRNLHSHHAGLSSPGVAASACPSPGFPPATATTAAATATVSCADIVSAASTPSCAVAGPSNWSSSSVDNGHSDSSTSNARGRGTDMITLDIGTLLPGAAAAAAATAAADNASSPPYSKQEGNLQASGLMAYTPSPSQLHHNRLLGGGGSRASLPGPSSFFNGYSLTEGPGPSALYPPPMPLQSASYSNGNGDGGRQFAATAATFPASSAAAAAFLTQQQYQQLQQLQLEQQGQAQGQGQGHSSLYQHGHFMDVLQDPAVAVLSSTQHPSTASHEPWSPNALYFRAPWLPATLPSVIRLQLAPSHSSSAASSPAGQCYDATRFGPGPGSVVGRRAQHPAMTSAAKASRRTVPSSMARAQSVAPAAAASKSGAGAGAGAGSGTGVGTAVVVHSLASQSSVSARVLKPSRKKRQIKNRVKPEDLLTETRFCSCCGKYKKQDQFDPERLTCEKCRGRA